MPNCLKNCPAIPGMKLAGVKIATMVRLIAMTASPISSAASMAAWNGDFPIRMWRTIFSISTIASSTRMPVLSVIARKLTRLSEKPSRSITQNAGKIDSGNDTADDRCTQIAHKKEHNTDIKSATLETRVNRGLIVAVCEINRRIDQLEIDIRVGLLELVDSLLHSAGDHHIARAARALDAKRHHRLAIESGKATTVGDRVSDDAEILEANFAAHRER